MIGMPAAGRLCCRRQKFIVGTDRIDTAALNCHDRLSCSLGSVNPRYARQRSSRSQTMPNVLLISANVGSLFDENPIIRTQWKSQISQAVISQKAKFVAIHFQETGGKEFKKYSKDVAVVITELSHLLGDFTCMRAFLDLNYDNIEEYTALGTVIYIHQDWISKVEQYRFDVNSFEHITEGTLIEENLSESIHVRKEKFAKDFWPAIRWGRKGFLHTRWRINSRIIDLINIHLFHDESNLELTQNPLLYSQNRKRALDYTVAQYNAWQSSHSEGESSCLFIYGDFNFRLRTDSFLEKITKDQEVHEIEDHKPSTDTVLTKINNSMHHTPLKRNLSAIEFRHKELKSKTDVIDQNIVLRIEKKLFDYCKPNVFVSQWQQYRECDTEPNYFDFKELSIKFPPTYPWSEDPTHANSYMKTRAPAWCDRVLMNEEAHDLVIGSNDPIYDVIGMQACMGDHKPVMLSFTLT
uniref:inositol-polyphosphate 5-phosphatase n=1 Tax=Panagrellus redivivus TaxID=6233 RepID=A0A7E4VRS2_PANRE